MKKILSLVLALSLVLGSALVLTSCGEPDDPGAQISVYLGDPIYDFDPSEYYADSNAEQLMSLLYEPLFYINEKGKLKNAAAEDYEVFEEERRIVIELRESYWSDGTRVIANDFIYAWRDIILEPNNANPAAALFYDIENAIEVKNGTLPTSAFGATASKYEITINYREGADYEQLLRNLASVAASPVRQSVAEQATGYWAKSVNTIATNGAFTLSTLNYEEGKLTLERNVGYHQPIDKKDYDNEVNPYKLVSFFTLDGSKVDCSYSDIEKNVVFFMGNASLADRKAQKENATVADALSTYTYVFDTTNPLFADANVRVALSLALNRAKIVKEITFAKEATGFLSTPVCKDIQQSLISASANMTKAQQLIDAVDFTGIEKAFTLTVNDDEESRKIAEIAVASWEQLGFTVTVEYVGYSISTVVDVVNNTETEVYDSVIQQRVIEAAETGVANFDAIGLDWQMYSTDPIVALSAFTSDMNGNGASFTDSVTTVKNNISGWTNTTYDSYIEKAYAAQDTDTRNSYLKKAEALLVSEMPVIPVVFNQTFAFTSDELRNVEFDGYGHVVFIDANLKNYEDYIPKED